MKTISRARVIYGFLWANFLLIQFELLWHYSSTGSIDTICHCIAIIPELHPSSGGGLELSGTGSNLNPCNCSSNCNVGRKSVWSFLRLTNNSDKTTNNRNRHCFIFAGHVVLDMVAGHGRGFSGLGYKKKNASLNRIEIFGHRRSWVWKTTAKSRFESGWLIQVANCQTWHHCDKTCCCIKLSWCRSHYESVPLVANRTKKNDVIRTPKWDTPRSLILQWVVRRAGNWNPTTEDVVRTSSIMDTFSRRLIFVSRWLSAGDGVILSRLRGFVEMANNIFHRRDGVL